MRLGYERGSESKEQPRNLDKGGFEHLDHTEVEFLLK